MSKQDRTYTRTPAEMEQKYNFGKTFAEVFGMAADAQKAAEKAQQAADDATGAIDDLDQDAIFNLLTNNGEVQGIYKEDGQIYINASYLKSGTIDASIINVINLVANALKSVNGQYEMSLDGASLRVENGDVTTMVITNHENENGQKYTMISTTEKTEDGTLHHSSLATRSLRLGGTPDNHDIYLDAYSSVDGSTNSQLTLTFKENGVAKRKCYLNPGNLSFVDADGSDVGSIFVGAFGSQLDINRINGKTVSWKDNGDGTFTLIGR